MYKGQQFKHLTINQFNYTAENFAPARILNRGELVSALGLAAVGDVTVTLPLPPLILIMLARAAPGDTTVLN